MTQDLLDAAEALKTHTALVDAQNSTEATELAAAKKKIGAHFKGLFAQTPPSADEIATEVRERF